MTNCTRIAMGVTFLLGAASASAQSFTLPWFTIDAGGGQSDGGGFMLSGTIGQHDASGPMTGGGFELVGGFWAGPAEDPCVADFNSDGSVNTLDVLAFLNAWNAEDPKADINGDGSINTLDVLAFLNAWTAGCP